MEAKRSSHVGDTRWCYKYSFVCIFSFLFLRSASFLYFPSTRTFIVSYKDFFRQLREKVTPNIEFLQRFTILGLISRQRLHYWTLGVSFAPTMPQSSSENFDLFTTRFFHHIPGRELTRFDDLNRNETENKKAKRDDVWNASAKKWKWTQKIIM